MKPKPVGGIKVIYQHCIILKKLGYDVYPVLMGSYHGDFYGYNLQTISHADAIEKMDSSDVVVATEFEPYQGLFFYDAIKVLFVQNWLGVLTRLNAKDKGNNYLAMGYDHVITCSDYCTSYVKKEMNIPASTVTNGIDLAKFYPKSENRVNNRILAMSRKNPEDLKKIIKMMDGSVFEFKIVDGLTEPELIKEYQAADIFLATGYPEGFGLPPLEAMACGCVVVGFTGGGGKEFMHENKTAFVADDGDVNAIVAQLKQIAENSELKETIRSNGLINAQKYGLENTQEQLKAFFQNIL